MPTTSLSKLVRRVSLCCALALLGQGAAAQAVVRVNGTGGGTGGMHLLARAFMQAHPDIKVEVRASVGSSGSIGALINRQIELAVSNRKPRGGELARQPLVSVEYARTPFVVAVSKNLGITELTSAQLAGLYAPGPARFPDGTRARPVLRRSDAGDTELLKSFSPEVAKAVDGASQRRGMLNANTDSEAADMIERTTGAFSVSTLALIESENRPLVALAIDGKAPTVANLANGTYPYQKSLYLVISADAGGNTQLFTAFVQSAAGRALLRAHGHAPV